MNDHEPLTDATETAANVGPTRADATPVVALTLGEIQARRDEIATAILAPDPSKRPNVSALVALFRDDIATAVANGRTWAEIATALSTSGILVRPDAVRMAYRRLPDQRHKPSARAPTRPVTPDPPAAFQRRPDPTCSADTLSRQPSIAPRVR